MRITSLSTLQADGGWQPLSFLKLETDTGLVGWAEFSDHGATQGLTQVIERLGRSLIGEDPNTIGRWVPRLYAQTRVAAGGHNAQAIAALENACTDLRAKALGVPVHALLGGKLRDRLPAYWSHCGMLRVRTPSIFTTMTGASRLHGLADVEALGQEVRRSGWRALKTNVMLFEDGPPRLHNPGFGRMPGVPDLTVDEKLVRRIVAQMEALRAGTGNDVALMLDLNFNCRPEGVRRIARALSRVGLAWLEVDMYAPDALAAIRATAPMPIASLEAIHGTRAMLPYLQAQAVDVAVVDVMWNGIGESMRLAALADAHEVDVATHNYAGHLAVAMAAQYAAALPNFRIFELDVEEARWVPSFYTAPIRTEGGAVVVTDTPGWGTDVNEDAVRARPWRGPPGSTGS